jgi:O-antigen/teichoic acid export membrane protein
VLQFVRTVILARLLAPDDFGMFGIAFLSLNLLETFSATGMWTALIQKRESIRPYLDTVWTIELIRAAGIALALFFCAPAIASFFNTPEAGPLVKVIGLAVVFQSLSNIAVVFFDKEIEYDKYFQLETARAISELLAALVAFLIFRNVWALMLGRIAGEMVYCAASYRIHPYRPVFSLNLDKAKHLFAYGKWILFSGILIFAVTRADGFVVGKLLGVTTLGIYQMAHGFTHLIATEMAFPVVRVIFPAYSKIRDNRNRLKDASLKVLQVMAFSAFLMALILSILADNIVLTLLGRTWEPVAAILQILVVPACLRLFQRTLAQMAKALGRPDMQTKVHILQVVILAACLYPGAVCLGAAGVALVVLIQGAAALLMLAGMVLPMIDLPYKAFLALGARQLLAACPAGIVLYVIQRQLPVNPITLGFEVILATLLYVGMTRILCRSAYQTLIRLKSELWNGA